MADWTEVTVTLREHIIALAAADQRALQIKESADERALQLARTIQDYKDEKANELRSQIDRERGTYATKDDLAAAISKVELQLKPVTDFVVAQQGRREGIGVSAGVLYAVLVLAVAVISFLVATYHH